MSPAASQVPLWPFQSEIWWESVLHVAPKQWNSSFWNHLSGEAGKFKAEMHQTLIQTVVLLNWMLATMGSLRIPTNIQCSKYWISSEQRENDVMKDNVDWQEKNKQKKHTENMLIPIAFRSVLQHPQRMLNINDGDILKGTGWQTVGNGGLPSYHGNSHNWITFVLLQQKKIDWTRMRQCGGQFDAFSPH